MLHDRERRQKAARDIVRDALRGEDGDIMGHLNPLSVKKHPFARTGVFIPTTDSAICRRVLIFLINELPNLVENIDRIPKEDAKCLHARSTLQNWNNAFLRLVKPKHNANKELHCEDF